MRIEELYNIKGATAIVTGGRTGIGLQISTALAEAGANVVIASRNYDKCIEVSKMLKREYRIKTLALKLDLTVEKDVIELAEKTVEKFGRIDILVNNSGDGIFVDTLSTELSDWKYIMDLNITGTFLCCREIGRYMVLKKYGKIINIASVYGFMGADPKNYIEPEKLKRNNKESLNYATSKGAIINLTRELAVNWAKYNITVNAISPGAFFTESTKNIINDYCVNAIKLKIPMNRWGCEDDLKGAIIFLASDGSKYITGHNLVIDGGWSCWC